MNDKYFNNFNRNTQKEVNTTPGFYYIHKIYLKKECINQAYILISCCF